MGTRALVLRVCWTWTLLATACDDEGSEGDSRQDGGALDSGADVIPDVAQDEGSDLVGDLADVTADGGQDIIGDDALEDGAGEDQGGDLADAAEDANTDPIGCVDNDNDLRGVGDCDPDCNDDDPDHWADCEVCEDNDGDDYGMDCDLGPDCSDDSGLMWEVCDCDDPDGDGYGPDCDRGEVDCAPGDVFHWSDCETCVDVDGDRHGDNCDLGADCDDSDFAVHSGRPDVPLNGVDDDCSDGDLIPSSTNGLFVSASAESDDGDGTPEAPFDTIQAAASVAGDRGLVNIYVATGTYEEMVIADMNAQLYGGFSADFTERSPDDFPTRLVGSEAGAALGFAGGQPRPAVAEPVVVDGFRIDGSFPSTGCWAVAFNGYPGHGPIYLTENIFNGGEGLDDCEGAAIGIQLGGGYAGAYIIDNQIFGGPAAVGHVASAAQIGGVAFLVNNRIESGNNWVALGVETNSTLDEITRVELINNVIVIHATAADYDNYALFSGGNEQLLALNNVIDCSDAVFGSDCIALHVASGAVILANNVLGTANGSSIELRAEAGAVTLVGNAFTGDYSHLLCQGEVCQDDLESLEACDWGPCEEAEANLIVADPGYTSGYEIDADSDLYDAGVDPADAPLLLTPGAALWDFQGDERPQNDSWDIGIDEVD